MLSWNKINRIKYDELRNVQKRTFTNLYRNLLPFHPYYKYFIDRKQTDVGNNIEKILSNFPLTSKNDLLPSDDNPKGAIKFILQPDAESINKNWSLRKKLPLLFYKLIHKDVKKILEADFKPIHFHFTTGRSASQIPFLYTEKDIDNLKRCGERVFKIIGASDDEIVINAFPFAPHLAFWFAYYATSSLKLRTLHTGGGKILGTKKIVEAVELMSATILLIMPGYGYHILKEAVAQKRNYKNLRYIILGGESVSDELREKMKELLHRLGSKKPIILSTYAFTEGKTAWIQCNEKSGYHLYPDLEHIDLVDKNGNSVGEGKPGEIVYSSLDWRGSTVVRYRTGDYSKGIYFSKPCKFCGRSLPRLDKYIERRVGMVDLKLTKVKGELINLNNLGNIIYKINGINEWQVELTKISGDRFDLDELVLHVSIDSNVNKQNVINDAKKLLSDEIFICPKVVIHDNDELVEMLGLNRELKEKRVVDNRNVKV